MGCWRLLRGGLLLGAGGGCGLAGGWGLLGAGAAGTCWNVGALGAGGWAGWRRGALGVGELAGSSEAGGWELGLNPCRSAKQGLVGLGNWSGHWSEVGLGGGARGRSGALASFSELI